MAPIIGKRFNVWRSCGNHSSSEVVHGSDSGFDFKIKYIRDPLLLYMLFFTIQISNFWGDLTDASAKTESLGSADCSWADQYHWMMLWWYMVRPLRKGKHDTIKVSRNECIVLLLSIRPAKPKTSVLKKDHTKLARREPISGTSRKLLVVISNDG